MATATLRRVGGSTMLAIPPAYAKELSLAPGSAVDVRLEDGRLVIEPSRRPRYTLDQLTAECDPDAPQPTDDGAWLDAAPTGGELI